MLQKVREKSFWMYDKLTGAKVATHLKDISAIFGSEEGRSNDRVERYLSELLSHAIKTADFYSNLSQGTTITGFPIVNKSVIKQNYEQFISNSYKKENLKPVVTSGSTGTPFKVLQDPNKVLRNTADTIFFANLAGYKLGQRLYYLKIWNEINKKGRASSFIQNVIPVDVMDQSDEFFSDFVRDLKADTTTKSLLGYASAFEALCKYLDHTGIEKVSSNVKSVITMSEALNSYTRKSLKKYFDCEPVSRYSNVENGILAQQKKGGSSFYLNTASYFFEILEMNSDDPASIGKPGRIVVTDLFNYGMPMIRYDTGDVAVLDSNESGDLALSTVEGRRMDTIYNTKGELISSYVITNNMWKYTDIKQYQFVQESPKSYYFKINTDNKFERKKELINEFLRYFGKDAEIRVEYVSEIPLLASGKRKKVVNMMHQT